MTSRKWILSLVALSAVLCAWCARGDSQPPAKVPEKLLQTQLDSARKTFEEMWKDQRFRTAEMPYQWSCRWLEAEHRLSSNKKNQRATLEAHLKRMKDLQQATDQLYQQKLVGIEQVYATAYYVAEAEVWVASKE